MNDINEIVAALGNLSPEQKKTLFNQLDPAEIKSLTGEAMRTGSKAYNAVLSDRDRMIEDLRQQLSSAQQQLATHTQKAVAEKEAELERRLSTMQNTMADQLKALQLQLAREKTLRNYTMDDIFEEMVVGETAEEIAQRAQAAHEKYLAYQAKKEAEILAKYGVDPNKGAEEKPPVNDPAKEAFKVNPELLAGLNEQQLALIQQALSAAPQGSESGTPAGETLDNAAPEMLSGNSAQRYGFDYINSQLVGRAAVPAANVSPAHRQVPVAAPRVDERAVRDMGPDEYRANRSNFLAEAQKDLNQIFSA